MAAFAASWLTEYSALVQQVALRLLPQCGAAKITLASACELLQESPYSIGSFRKLVQRVGRGFPVLSWDMFS